MNVRRTNQILWSACVLFAAAGIGALFWALTTQPQVQTPDVRRGGHTSAATSQAGGNTSLASFQSVWMKDLRRPLEELTAQGAGAAQTLPATAASAAPVTLVGTIGQSLAILQLASGQVEVRGPGETIGNVKIIEVRTSEVDVEIGGQRTTLVRPRD